MNPLSDVEKKFYEYMKSSTEDKVSLLKEIFEKDKDGELSDIPIEALRSNREDLFETVCFLSDYPSKHFDEKTFNQMAIKALFLKKDIFKIHNFKLRDNEKLQSMIVDYKEELELANREISESHEEYIKGVFHV